jgi:hypothetical protein
LKTDIIDGVEEIQPVQTQTQGTKYQKMKNRITIWLAQPTTGMMFMVLNALMLGFEIAMVINNGITPARAAIMPLMAFVVVMQWRSLRMHLPRFSSC